jgi:hypothetical protein
LILHTCLLWTFNGLVRDKSLWVRPLYHT